MTLLKRLKKKWDYLADIRARTGAKTLYINSTPHGVYQFDLGAITEPEWALKRLPITTDFGNKATNGVLRLSELGPNSREDAKRLIAQGELIKSKCGTGFVIGELKK